MEMNREVNNMEGKLRKGLIAVLEEGCKAQIPEYREIKGLLSEDEYAHCFHILRDSRHIAFSEGYGYYTSLSGREYLYRLKHSVKAWGKDNWFAFSVAIATITVAITGVVVQIVS